MSKYVIKGGISLKGDVTISGAKNATLPIMAAAILTDEKVKIENIPDVRDVNIMLDCIECLGGIVDRIDRNSCVIDASTINEFCLNNSKISKMRATYYFVGALLGKYKKAKVLHPGGCDIGDRPIDFHLKGFKRLGANAYENDGYIIANAENLVGNNIYLDIVSVGATINIMLASVLATGITIIENAAREPHVVDFANFLNSMGANIKGAGTDTIRIRGVNKLHGTSYTVIADQIEAGTYMVLSAITGGDITIKNIIPKHLESITAKIVDIGAKVMLYDEAVRVIFAGEKKATCIKTLPYPGFPTDMQPQFAALLGLSKGKSIINEGIYEKRFKYVTELEKLGANMKVSGQTLEITGIEKYKGANLTAPDLRAGAALVLAALGSEGISVIDKIEYIERGYEDFEYKLQQVGAKIQKINTDEELRFFIKENL